MATAGNGQFRNGTVDKNEPARPLTVLSPSVHPTSRDAEAGAQDRSTQKRRRLVRLCGCVVALMVFNGVAILALSLTVLKFKEPRVNVDNAWLTAVSAGPAASPVAANATLTAELSIRNPNFFSFKFSQIETDASYRGETVSVAYLPDGKVRFKKTRRYNVSLDLLGDRLTRATNGTGLVFGQEYQLDTYTKINGKIKVPMMTFYKKNYEIRLNCSILVDVGSAADGLRAGVASTVQSKAVNCVVE